MLSDLYCGAREDNKHRIRIGAPKKVERKENLPEGWTDGHIPWGSMHADRDDTIEAWFNPPQLASYFDSVIEDTLSEEHNVVVTDEIRNKIKERIEHATTRPEPESSTED